MTHSRTPSTSSRQRGLSLVELMISMVIGLILLGALSYILIGSRQVGKTDDDVSRMQESGRYAMEIIGKAIRQAGYRLDVSQPFGDKLIEGVNGASSAPDSITIRHDPVLVKDATNEMRGSEPNCAGGIITSDNDMNLTTGVRPVNSKLVVYTFSIDNGQLKCTTVSQAGANPPAIVADGIEDMQIEYGLDSGANGIITSYVDASSITDANRSQVAAVRVSLLVKGASASAAANKTQTYYFNGASATKTDGFIRQVYTSTFTLRNQAK